MRRIKSKVSFRLFFIGVSSFFNKIGWIYIECVVTKREKQSYEFGEAKRYDVLSHSYDFAFGKSYGMIALVTSNVALPLITQRSCS